MAESITDYRINIFGSFIDEKSRDIFIQRLNNQKFKLLTIKEKKDKDIAPSKWSPMSIHIKDEWAWLCFLEDVSCENPNLVIDVYGREESTEEWHLCFAKIKNGKHLIRNVELKIPAISEKELEQA
jgi:hypothetical protein